MQESSEFGSLASAAYQIPSFALHSKKTAANHRFSAHYEFRTQWQLRVAWSNIAELVHADTFEAGNNQQDLAYWGVPSQQVDKVRPDWLAILDKQPLMNSSFQACWPFN